MPSDPFKPLRENISLLWFALAVAILAVGAAVATEYVRYENAQRRFVALLNLCTSMDKLGRSATEAYDATKRLNDSMVAQGYNPSPMGTPPASFDLADCFAKAERIRPRFPY
jgi:hypothetical protein